MESVQKYKKWEIVQTITRMLEDEGQSYHVINELKLKDGSTVVAQGYYNRINDPPTTE